MYGNVSYSASMKDALPSIPDSQQYGYCWVQLVKAKLSNGVIYYLDPKWTYFGAGMSGYDFMSQINTDKLRDILGKYAN